MRLRLRVINLIIPIGGLLGLVPSAEAGWLVSPSVKWGSFALRPKTDEPTPNYYAYGGGLALGYSVKQVFDMALVGHYLPGRTKAAKFGQGDAALLFYGGELGFRIADIVYLGLRGGFADYRLVHETEALVGQELQGRWQGPGAAIVIGAVYRASKQSFFQTCLEVMHTVMSDTSNQVTEKRRFDSFAISLAYVFNKQDNGFIDSKIFKDFLDTVIFF